MPHLRSARPGDTVSARLGSWKGFVDLRHPRFQPFSRPRIRTLTFSRHFQLNMGKPLTELTVDAIPNWDTRFLTAAQPLFSWSAPDITSRSWKVNLGDRQLPAVSIFGEAVSALRYHTQTTRQRKAAGLANRRSTVN